MDNNIVRSQDTCSVIERIAMNPASSELTYNFVKKNWAELYKRFAFYFFREFSSSFLSFLFTSYMCLYLLVLILLFFSRFFRAEAQQFNAGLNL